MLKLHLLIMMLHLLKLTVFALVTAPVDAFIKSTIGMIATKLVPVILIVVADAGAIVCETSATVGFVSVILQKIKHLIRLLLNELSV